MRRVERTAALRKAAGVQPAQPGVGVRDSICKQERVSTLRLPLHERVDPHTHPHDARGHAAVCLLRCFPSEAAASKGHSAAGGGVCRLYRPVQLESEDQQCQFLSGANERTVSLLAIGCL